MKRAKFNEGKALDAVLRVLEKAAATPRGLDLRSPEKERHAAPVDLVCSIGPRLYALEHTGIEPFQGQIAMSEFSRKLFQPVIERLRDTLPVNESFELHVPVDATIRTKLTPKGVATVQDTLVSWITCVAKGLPLGEFGRYATPIQKIAVPGVPFEVSLHRLTPLGPELCGLQVLMTHGGDLEEERRERLRYMCDKKYGKLGAWKLSEARTVLVLEDADIQLTNHVDVASALRQVESTRTDVPDDVYLVTTYIEARWHVILLRRGSWEESFREGEPWEYTKFDPRQLTDLTGR